MARTQGEDPAEFLRLLCAEVGFDLGNAKSSLVERMCLLAEYTHIYDDAQRMAGYAHAVFRHCEGQSAAFSPLDKQTVVLGCLFSDVGKTGPEQADAASRRLVAEMFSVEGVTDDQMPVATFLQTYFDDGDARIDRFSKLGLDATMTIRQFWNLHSDWTLAIAETAGLASEAVAAAASHHFLDNINPQAIIGADARFTRSFGANTGFDRAEKLIIVLDKYDAVRRRGHKPHDAAIAWIRAHVAKNPRFCDDQELLTLITHVDEALAPTER